MQGPTVKERTKKMSVVSRKSGWQFDIHLISLNSKRKSSCMVKASSHCHWLYIDILKLMVGYFKLLAQLQSKFPGGNKLKIHLKLKLKPVKLHYFKASAASTRFFNPSYLKLKYDNQIITVNKSEMVIYFIHRRLVRYGHHNRPPC